MVAQLQTGKLCSLRNKTCINNYLQLQSPTRQFYLSETPKMRLLLFLSLLLIFLFGVCANHQQPFHDIHSNRIFRNMISYKIMDQLAGQLNLTPEEKTQVLSFINKLVDFILQNEDIKKVIFEGATFTQEAEERIKSFALHEEKFADFLMLYLKKIMGEQLQWLEDLEEQTKKEFIKIVVENMDYSDLFQRAQVTPELVRNIFKDVLVNQKLKEAMLKFQFQNTSEEIKSFLQEIVDTAGVEDLQNLKIEEAGKEQLEKVFNYLLQNQDLWAKYLGLRQGA